MSILTVNWPGQTRAYTFGVFTISDNWNNVPGIYVFAKETSPGTWASLYVGESGSLYSRLNTSHEEWANAQLLGATHVHAMVFNGTDLERKTIESDLIQSLQPPLNQKLSVGIGSLLRS